MKMLVIGGSRRERFGGAMRERQVGAVKRMHREVGQQRENE
jgi:hypothetical protein